MKTRLNCHERARMSAAAATGSIASIFDISMARGGRQQRPTAPSCGRPRGVSTSPFGAASVLGRRPKQLLYGDLGGKHLGSPRKNLHQPWTTARHYLPKDAAPYRSRTPRPRFDQ
jgi:hypothetical protein